MSKIHLRLDLLQARFPDLYEEAHMKMAGGVDRKDILADWLNELVCWRNMNGFNQAEKPIETDDLDDAMSVMDSLT